MRRRYGETGRRRKEKQAGDRRQETEKMLEVRGLRQQILQIMKKSFASNLEARRAAPPT